MEVTTNMIIGSVVNLITFFAVIFFAAKKPMTVGLQASADKTAEILKQAETQLASMTAKLAEQKQLLGDLQSQVAQIKANGETISKNLADDVIAGAKAEGEAMRIRVAREVEQDLFLANQKLRHELGKQALSQAERILTERLDAGKQQDLIGSFASQLGSQHGSNGGHN